MKSVSMKFIFAFSLLLFAAAVGTVSAYVINFEAPGEVTSGDEFVLSGTSTLPEGFSSEVVVYKKAQIANKQVGKYPFTIGADKTWKVVIDTTGWDAGTYNLEIEKDPDYSYGGSSDLTFIFTVTEPKVKATSAPTSVSTPGQTSAGTSAPATTTGSQPAATASQTPAPAAKTSPAAVWTVLLGLMAVFAVAFTAKRM